MAREELKMKATIENRLIQSLALMTPKNDVRVYLNAIYIAEGRAVVTNGHYLLLVRIPEFEGEDHCYIMPDWIKGIKTDNVEIETVGDGVMVNGITYPKYDQGRYPDYRRVIPEKTSGKPAKYSMQYLAMFAKVEKLLGKGTAYDKEKEKFISVPGMLTIHHNGEKAAIITSNASADFLGVLMPIRDGNTGPFETPLWAFNREEGTA